MVQKSFGSEELCPEAVAAALARIAAVPPGNTLINRVTDDELNAEIDWDIGIGKRRAR